MKYNKPKALSPALALRTVPVLILSIKTVGVALRSQKEPAPLSWGPWTEFVGWIYKRMNRVWRNQQKTGKTRCWRCSGAFISSGRRAECQETSLWRCLLKSTHQHSTAAFKEKAWELCLSCPPALWGPFGPVPNSAHGALSVALSSLPGSAELTREPNALFPESPIEPAASWAQSQIWVCS